MKIHKQIYFILLLLLLGCSSLKKSMITSGENPHEIAINNAIWDFSTNCRLFRQDSVFMVTFKDSVFNKGSWVRVDEKTFEDRRTHERKRGALCDGIIGVEIGINDGYQFYYSEETKATLPSRYVIENGKLFYWWDHNYPVTDEIIAIMWKYNILQEDLIIPEFSTDELQEGADYYYCKYDLSKYKRVITNIATGYYKPPKLKCKNK